MKVRDTSIVLDTGSGHLVGPEWSPDGAWIYVNTESFTPTRGHAQLARIPDGGGDMERLVESSSVGWFPHLSPDGRFATYMAFPAGTTRHPPDLDVDVRVVATTDWSTSLQSYPRFAARGRSTSTAGVPTAAASRSSPIRWLRHESELARRRVQARRVARRPSRADLDRTGLARAGSGGSAHRAGNGEPGVVGRR
jgi:hypothetical protein